MLTRPLKHPHTNQEDPFEELPDDLIILILTKLSSTASSPSDFFNVLLTCRRLNRLALHRIVLSKAGPGVLSVKPNYWSNNSHSFFKRCLEAGNVDACYILGMILFYCLQNRRRSGLFLIAKAAMKLYAPALYSLAVIQFNGSGGPKQTKDIRAGVALSARASELGHIDALRELGHCLQDGYGVKQNVAEGRRLLVKANISEIVYLLRALEISSTSRAFYRLRGLPSLTDMAVSEVVADMVYNANVNIANRFLRGWFESGRGKLEDGLTMCSHIGCGRVETRPHEFRRCAVCGKVNYCSRACQTLDWKFQHKNECLQGPWLANGGGGGGGGVVEGGGGEDGEVNMENDMMVVHNV